MATESKTKTTKAKGGGANAPRFHNQLYRAEVGRTPAGSPILKLTATNPTGRYAQHRQLAAFIYELAAEMERRSDDLGARWVISPEATNARVVIELAADHETTLADEFVASVIADNDLACGGAEAMNDDMKMKGTAVILGPNVEPHDDPSRVIGRRTTYHGDEHPYLRGYDVVIVAVLKGALRVEEHSYLTSEEDVRRAGGVSADDRIEVAPFLPEEGRISFVTSDPRAIDLEAFRHLARGGTNR